MIMATIVGLHHFQIKGNGSSSDRQLCRVYKNGRQQFQVDIVIDAYDAQGAVVALTPAQLNSIQMVNYDSGANLGTQLNQSYYKNAYDFFPSKRLQDTGIWRSVVKALRACLRTGRKQNMSTVTMYFSVPTSISVASLQIAAKITLDGGANYATNKRNADPGGHFNNGGFNSSIVLEPVTPYTLTAQDFQIVKNPSPLGWGSGSNYTGDPLRYLDLWIITLRNTAYKILGSDIPTLDYVHWFSQYVRGGNDLDTCHWALPVLPLNSTITLGWNRSGGGSTTKDIYVQPFAQAGKAYAIIERAKTFQIHDYRPKRITYIDNFGCEHSVVLRPNNNGTTFQIDDQ
jgi:hypothetical protein